MLNKFSLIIILLCITFITSCSPKESERSESKIRNPEIDPSAKVGTNNQMKKNNQLNTDEGNLPNVIERALIGLPLRLEREGGLSLTSNRVDIFIKYSEHEIQEYFGKNLSIRECTIEQFRAIILKNELSLCKSAHKCKLVVENVAATFLDLHEAFNDSYRVLQNAAELNDSKYCTAFKNAPTEFP
jgi:hypothetical protein